ncbi:hypothetical protein CEXT_326541 [Caerostris extrusa]|uniref:Uncharacterized protein n=1 Tax=Caerostris extrusa TaxID=172846 RepID=A0AAV4XB35_CAEEX|nr:hypothetical protein CEXT_326541 [Caerostris extrusa]
MAPPTAPPFLLARNTPFGRGYRLDFAERSVNRNCHRAYPDDSSGQPSNCSTRLRFSFEVDSVSGLLKIWRYYKIDF